MKDNYQNQMKLSQMKILVAVADRSNFSEAALHLEMSQSAVSHGIAALEEHLGVILFLRGRHGAHLTPVGERIVEHAREIVNRAEAITVIGNVSKRFTRWTGADCFISQRCDSHLAVCDHPISPTLSRNRRQSL